MVYHINKMNSNPFPLFSNSHRSFRDKTFSFFSNLFLTVRDHMTHIIQKSTSSNSEIFMIILITDIFDSLFWDVMVKGVPELDLFQHWPSWSCHTFIVYLFRRVGYSLLEIDFLGDIEILFRNVKVWTKMTESVFLLCWREVAHTGICCVLFVARMCHWSDYHMQ